MANTQTTIRVIRFEGVSTLTCCQVFQNSEQIESLLPIISEKRVKIQDESIYRIVAFSGSTHFSVSFKSNLLDEDGMFWLPLVQDSDDFIESHVENADEPRVLILVHKKIVEENKSHLVTEESAYDYDFMPEIKLDYSESTYNAGDCIDILSGNQRFEEGLRAGSIEGISKEEMGFAGDFGQENFGRERFQKYSSFENENIENFEPFQDSPLILLKSIETHDDQLQNPEINHSKMLEMSINYQSSLNTHKKFAESILQEVEKKNSQLTQALNDISSLKTQKYKLEIENNYLKGMNNGFIGAQIDELVNELGACKKRIWELEQGTESNENKHGTRSKLEGIIKAECEKLNAGLVVKDEEEVFSVYGKKYNLLLKDGKLVCRLGSVYKDFHQVLLSHKSENKSIVQKTSKSPFRKNLCELNSSIDTPRSLSRPIDPALGKLKKQNVLKRGVNNTKKVV